MICSLVISDCIWLGKNLDLTGLLGLNLAGFLAICQNLLHIFPYLIFSRNLGLTDQNPVLSTGAQGSWPSPPQQVSKGPTQVADCNPSSSLHVASLEIAVDLDWNSIISTWNRHPVWPIVWRVTLLAEMQENVFGI